MSSYVAAYDISEDRRRVQVAKFLLQWGVRVQRSVFEVWIEPEDLDEFRRDLGILLLPDDEFDLYPIEVKLNRRKYRWQRPPHEWKPVLLL